MSRPVITDDDSDTISISVDGRLRQSWVYSNDDEQKHKMRLAWAWCDGYTSAAKELAR